MPVGIVSDFFKASEFAESVTLAGFPVVAIFDSAYEFGDVGGTGMASVAPVLTLATSNVPANPVGVIAIVQSISYRIAAHEPDGTGVSMLMLERTT